MVMNLIDFEMSLQEALDAPRVSFVEPDVLAVEEQIPESVRSRLEALGHNVRTVGGLGNAHALAIEYDAGGHPVRFVGAADRRGVGSAEVR